MHTGAVRRGFFHLLLTVLLSACTLAAHWGMNTLGTSHYVQYLFIYLDIYYVKQSNGAVY